MLPWINGKDIRIPFRKCFKLGVGVGKTVAITLGLILTIDLFIDGFTLDSVQFALVLITICSLGGILITTPLVFVIAWFYPVKVDLSGITSSTYSGRIKKFTWEEMDTLSTTSPYGIPYLIINNFNDKSIWIPEILDDQKGFQSIVLDLSRKKNPKLHAFFSALIKTRETYT